ncbi:Stk1 family PASTA domain-containing Ser/Thr kinase [Rhodococcus sp. NPDC019627]|uniref:Stk1 family PASTA domain-containing Ser/Thr kinase n=1 Tax=unclassified Rhodococcus (in: high G+C Gram-positive bacteria) TaxID=192944 RepID=UPI0033D82614
MHDGGQRLIGELLDRRYRVDALIARGGMSTVYRGLDMRLDRPVAIKVMDPQFAADPAFVSRFEFEARSVARLGHPSLVAVYDQGHDREHAFLVMELVDGGTLRELLRERGPMPPHAVAAVAGPVLDALAVAHRAGLVHRDVKPENILISDGGEVKIADFGLVRAAAASNTTSNSVILGTAAYLSPEQVTSGVADTRSDVYSTGILLFELLTGRTPFTGDTSLSVAYQRINQDVPRPGSYIAGVPHEFDELVAEATHREPSHRFANAEQMGTALRSIAAALELPTYRVPAPRRSAQHLAAAASAPPLTSPPSPLAPPTAHLPAAPLHAPLPHHSGQPGIQHTRIVTAGTPRPPMDGHGSDGDDEPDEGYRYPDFAAERQRSRRTTILWLLVVLMLALAVGFGGWWMGSGRYTAVPAIDGLDRGAAVSAIEAAGLSSEIRGEYSDTAALDTVLGTDPPGGSRISRDGTVALVVSLGQPTVPPLPAGGDRSEIERELRHRTFMPVDGGQAFSAKVPIGAVAALDPAPGTSLPTGSQVKLIVSKGAPPVDIPDVRGMSEAEARASLEAVGIVVQDTATDFDRKVEEGDVIATDPKAGTQVSAGSSVTLTVSNAVRVPSMLGRTVGSARDELTRLGLEVKVRQVTDTDRSVVISQNPGSGDLVKPGSTITLVSLP